MFNKLENQALTPWVWEIERQSSVLGPEFFSSLWSCRPAGDVPRPSSNPRTAVRMCPHFYSLRLKDSFLALAGQQSLWIHLWQSLMLSAGECPRALQPLLPSCRLSWSLAAGQGTCSLPFLVSSSGLTACWLSAPVSLHTAPSLPPCGPQKSCTPMQPSSEPRIGIDRCSSCSVHKCPPAHPWVWEGLNPHPTSEV